MNNYEKYVNAFVETFSVAAGEAEKLEYQGISEWDSVGHMGLVAAIEDAFALLKKARKFWRKIIILNFKVR